MTKPLPKREQLKCPLCHRDVGGLLSYEEIRQWLKRQERRASVLRRRVLVADRKKAAVMLRRLVMKETNLELKEAKKLGLRELSNQIVELILNMDFELEFELGSGPTPEKQLQMAAAVEKKIVEYFTSPISH